MSDQATEGVGSDAVGERRTITPQPKRIVNLSNTLGSRPAPRRPQPAPSEPAPASPASPETESPSPSASESEPTPITKAREDARCPRCARRGRGVEPERPGAGCAAPHPAARPHRLLRVAGLSASRCGIWPRRADLTNADVIFDAIEATQDQLPRLLTVPSPRRRGPGCSLGRSRGRSARRCRSRTVISASNLAAIDGLVEQPGADSRSHLVEVALRAHFDLRRVSFADAFDPPTDRGEEGP